MTAAGPDHAALAEARNVLGRLRYEDVILGREENALFTLLPEYDRRGELIAELERALADARVIVTMMGRKLGPPRRPGPS